MTFSEEEGPQARSTPPRPTASGPGPDAARDADEGTTRAPEGAPRAGRQPHPLPAPGEDALRRRIATLDAVIDAVPDAIYIGDAQGVIQCNRYALDLVGARSLDDLRAPDLARKFNVRWPDSDEPVAHEEQPFFRALRGETAVEEIVATHAQTGEDLYLRAAAAPIVLDGEIVGAVGITTDITERRATERSLRAAKAQLEALTRTLETRIQERTEQVRALSSALSMAEQHERARIAQILHDDLQQVLYGLRLRLQELVEDLSDHRARPAAYDAERDHAAAAETIARANELVGRALSITRTLTLDLKPPILSTEGLEASLSWLAQHMHETHGLDVAVHVRTPTPLPDQHLHVLLFQLVRELLFNVVKHAGVDEADLTVGIEDGGRGVRVLRVAVEDRGRGFDAGDLAGGGRSGFGLFSVRERLALVGGHIEITSAPEAGTRALLTLPLDGSPPLHRPPPAPPDRSSP